MTDEETIQSVINNRDIQERKRFEREASESNRRLESKKTLIEDLQNEYDLLQEQAFKMYKNYVVYYGFEFTYNVSEAIEWIDKINSKEKIDKRRKYSEKQNYEFFNTKLSAILGIDVTIKKIIDYNYQQGYYYVFDYNNNTYEMFIPIVSNVDLKNFKYDGEYAFKARLSIKETECSSRCLKSSFYLSDFKDILNKEENNEEK